MIFKTYNITKIIKKKLKIKVYFNMKKLYIFTIFLFSKINKNLKYIYKIYKII